MVSIGVLVSGNGTNLQAIIDAIFDGHIANGKIEIVIADREGAYALERAEQAGIKTSQVLRKQFPNSDDFNDNLIAVLKKNKVGLVILGGFLSILNKKFIKEFKNRIINIHPSLIPSFCGKGLYGLKVHKSVLDYGVKVTGATAHFVNEEIDGGPIILQKSVPVPEGIAPEALQRKVMEEAEWVILPEAINLFCTGRLKIEGRNIKIAEE